MLADRALRSEFESVLCLEAPEPAEVPRSLLRADGRSVYQRHGGVRYATRAQLAMEERMVARASAGDAPRMTRAEAAQALGADLERLESALEGRASGARDQPTETGLREDQAAAALSVLTDGRRVSVINAPAGSGKTHVVSEIANQWAAAALGPVIGITASQSARNTLAAGVAESYNSAQFLGHLPGPARRPRPSRRSPRRRCWWSTRRSTMPGPDLADLISLAEANNGKVIVAGDTGQLQAVENGGGMSLLADRLGYVRLVEPVRFREPWEQAASLRLRDGDAAVLAEYDEHARIIGGEPEEMMDAAASAYVALAAEGTDALLMAADHSLRRELARRIRDDLIRLGLIDPGPGVSIADGATASRGDLIVCTRNDHGVEAGEPGRTLANGDLLRIDDITPRGPARPPRPGRRPRNRAAPMDRPAVPVRALRRGRAGLRGHRPHRPGPHRAHRPGRDHRHRGPPARVRRPHPRHRRQPGLRLRPVPETRRPRPRPPPGPRASPLRPTRRPARRPRPDRRGQ